MADMQIIVCRKAGSVNSSLSKAAAFSNISTGSYRHSWPIPALDNAARIANMDSHKEKFALVSRTKKSEIL